jgi:hypothetical protein
MGHAEVTRVVVTRSDGTLIGLFFAADVGAPPDLLAGRVVGGGRDLGALASAVPLWPSRK